MKIFYLGEIGPGQTALMRMRGLERLGHSVLGVLTSEPWNRTAWATRQLQRRTHRGSVVEEIIATILRAALEFKPDVVWADKQKFPRADPKGRIFYWLLTPFLITVFAIWYAVYPPAAIAARPATRRVSHSVYRSHGIVPAGVVRVSGRTLIASA
jgi:hypothetical protein